MCIKQTQKQDQQNEVVINAHREELNEVNVQNDALLLDNQQDEHQVEVPGEEMAHNINAHLPAGGDGALPPPEPPPAPVEAVAEPKTKKERNLQKRRQKEAEQRAREEAEQRRAEEAERRQREREETQRRMEAERQEQRRLIFTDDNLIKLISEFANETNPQLAIEKAKVFLKNATKKLMANNEDMAGVFGATVDYGNDVVSPFRLLIKVHVADKDTADELLEKANEHQESFEKLAEERPIISALNNMMFDVLREEYAASDLFEKAVDQLTEDYDTRSTEQTNLWSQFETDVAKSLRMLPKDSEQLINVFGNESPFKYLSKKATAEKFNTQIEQLMAQDKTLTREAAEQQVFARHRAELQENAERQTLNGSVVQGVSAEKWREYGGASYHHVLPAAQAYAIVEKSDGFLYAKPAGNGLCELRPTIPETVQINGETIPLRRSYTLFIKALMHRIFDDNGDLRENAKENLDDASYYFTKYGLQGRPPEDVMKNLRDQLGDTMVEILGSKEEAEQTLTHLHKLITNSADFTFPPLEIMDDFVNTVARIKFAGNNSSAVQRIEQVRKKMVKEGSSPEEIDEVMKQLVNPDLVERAYEKRMEFIEKNGSAPLTKEQEDEISAIYSMYADVDMAIKEMMAIRNMNPNSLDAPLPNSCSANGLLIAGIRKNYMQKQDEFITYRTVKHLIEKPLEHIDYYISHIDKLGTTDDARNDALEKLLAIAERIRNGEDLSSPEGNADYNLLSSYFSMFQKYEYHVAANLGNADDDTIITSEGFAAETKQYVVPAFSRHHAVGLYRGKPLLDEKSKEYDIVSNGMIGYYNIDNPLPNDEEKILVSTKLSWLSKM